MKLMIRKTQAVQTDNIDAPMEEQRDNEQRTTVVLEGSHQTKTGADNVEGKGKNCDMATKNNQPSQIVVDESRGKKMVTMSLKLNQVTTKKKPLATDEVTAAVRADPKLQCSSSKQFLSNSKLKGRNIPRIHSEDLSYKNPEGMIGSGSYGKCFKGLYRGNIPVVVKKFQCFVNEREVKKEAEVMQDIQGVEHHPSLPLLIGIRVNIRPYLLVSQFHGGNDCAYTLASGIRSELLTTPQQWLEVLIDLTTALGFIHQKGWIHDDLKENNVVLHLINNKWKPVIIDFGKSVKIGSAKCSLKTRDAKVYYWKAPEVLSGKSPPSTLSDIFSLGQVIKYVAKKAIKIKSFEECYECCLTRVSTLRPSSAQMVAAKLEAFKKTM